ncbi:MAG: hypothetical protein AB7F50_11315 [Fimbriimonadaceae bacterium]
MALAASAQVSGPGAWVPSRNGTTGQSDPMPFYFSGTDCRASGEAVCPGLIGPEANWMVEAWLSLNGQNLKYWQKPPGEPGSTTVDLNLVFDSTHFPPQTNVEVRFKAKGSHGNFYEATGSSIVKNAAVALNLYAFNGVWGGLGAAIVGNELASSNYTLFIDLGPDWDKESVAFHQQHNGVYYVNSHGSQGIKHQTNGIVDYGGQEVPEDVFSYGAVDAYDIYKTDVAGVGLFPFNSTGIPPTLFAHLDFCTAMENVPRPSDFGVLLYPYSNAYGDPPARNQAVFGYNGYTLVDESENSAWHMFSRMAGGATAHKARGGFIIAQLQGHPRAVQIGPTVNGPFSRVDEIADCPLLGDFHTRIRFVYTGSSLLPSTLWYR